MLFIPVQVSAETATNIISDLEERLAEADRTIAEERAANYRTRTSLYATQDQLSEMTNKLQADARMACTANHYPNIGKIPMIRLLRAVWPFVIGDEKAVLGLKEAKDAIEAAMAADKLKGV